MLYSTQETPLLSTGGRRNLSVSCADAFRLSPQSGAQPQNWEKAREVGERVPDYCLGNPNYRMITIIRFIRKRGPIMRKIAMAVVKHRVTEAAKRLQSRYDTNKIMRDARQDIFTVTDFDGTVSSQLEAPAGATEFCVFVFGRDGELLVQWHDVPSAKQLAEVLK